MDRALSILLVLAALAAPARAQSVEAETLFVEGEKLMAAGEVDKACAAFAASNRLEARAGTLINLGLCEEKRQRFASAWIAFREALTRVKDPVKKQVATERAAAVEARLSYLTIELPDAKIDALTVTRDDQPVDPALFGRAIPIDGGQHWVVANAPGRIRWSGAVQIANEHDKATVRIPPLAEGTGPVAVPVAPHDSGNRHRGMAITFGVVGIAALGVGIWGGVTSRSLDRDADALCPDLSMPCTMASEANELLDRRDTRALIANIGYGVAAAGAIAATVAWLTGRTSSSADVAVAPARDGATLTVRVGF